MRCKLVAEIGINHNGSMANVKRMIKIAAAAGFDYVKFQKRTVEVTTPKDKWNESKDTPWGLISYFEYKKKLELSPMEYNAIETWCVEDDVRWYASPWDVDSIQLLKAMGVPYIKLASAANTDQDLLQAVGQAGIPIIMSTGMTDKSTFDKAINLVGRTNVEYILACTSTYPTAVDEMNLNFISTLKKEYGSAHRIGFSNHNPGIFLAATAVAIGAEMVEVHVTLDRSMWGSDQAASIEPEGQVKFCKYVRSIERAMGSGDWIVWDSEEPVSRNLRWKDYS